LAKEVWLVQQTKQKKWIFVNEQTESNVEENPTHPAKLHREHYRRSLLVSIFCEFCKRNPHLSEKYQREKDQARHNAMNENTIQRHLFGQGRAHVYEHCATKRHGFGRGQGAWLCSMGEMNAHR
jgi:hypothetical protein